MLDTAVVAACRNVELGLGFRARVLAHTHIGVPKSGCKRGFRGPPFEATDD